MQDCVKLETCPFRGLFLSRKGKQENGSFRTIINMVQYPNTSTKTLMHQDQPPPNLQLLVINLKLNQDSLKTHMTTSIIWKIPIMKISLLLCMNNTSEKILEEILKMWMRKKWLKKNYKNSSIYWPQLPITNNELGSYYCPSQWPRQLYWWPRIFFPVLHLGPMCTWGKQNSNHSHPY